VAQEVDRLRRGAPRRETGVARLGPRSDRLAHDRTPAVRADEHGAALLRPVGEPCDHAVLVLVDPDTLGPEPQDAVRQLVEERLLEVAAEHLERGRAELVGGRADREP
jgi:hypothetical protein